MCHGVFFSAPLQRTWQGVSGDHEARRKGRRDLHEDAAVKLRGWQGQEERKERSYLFARWHEVCDASQINHSGTEKGSKPDQSDWEEPTLYMSMH